MNGRTPFICSAYDKQALPVMNKACQWRTIRNSFHMFKSDWNLVRIRRLFLKLGSSLKKRKQKAFGDRYKTTAASD